MALSIFIKLLGTVAELMLPYILEHIIDHVVPAGKLAQVLGWGPPGQEKLPLSTC